MGQRDSERLHNPRLGDGRRTAETRWDDPDERLLREAVDQKITDIYATSIDYDPTATATKRFFAAVQNKLHYAVHQHTAAELIYERADAEKAHMGLTTWEGAPEGKIHRYDVVVAKNYLTDEELQTLARMVSAYLDFAEVQAIRHIPMTMADWEERLNSFLKLWDRNILQDSGKISAELAQMKAETEFEKYRIVQDQLYQSDFDRFATLPFEEPDTINPE